MCEIFRGFWNYNAGGDGKLVEIGEMMPICPKDLPRITTSPQPLKRKALVQETTEHDVCVKRARMEYNVATPPQTPAVPHQEEYFDSPPSQATLTNDRIADIINEQFGTEILLKHQELRFINQELARCQVALEQLRRCHLIPYPISHPTPRQILEIAQGRGPATPSKTDEPAAQWAPPFGVVNGPYARHYAKWLIPDPIFGDVVPEWQGISVVPRSAVEGRTTRNSLTEANSFGKRFARGQTGQKLGTAYPPQKPKAPCIVRRSNGAVVKLVCNSCHREDFSSTQGFINHCRIAHRKEYKSHEEAAVDCGQPTSISPDETGGPANEEKPSGTLATGVVHALARTDALGDQSAYATLLQRVDKSLKLLNQGNRCTIPRNCGVTPPHSSVKVVGNPSKSFAAAPATPFLSQLLQERDFDGDLSEFVEDAKSRVDIDTLLSGDDDSDDAENLVGSSTSESAKSKAPTAGARIPAPGARVPARAVPPPPTASGPHPISSKGCSPHSSLASPSSVQPPPTRAASNDDDDCSMDDSSMLGVDHSPNVATSNNAPSLVSDDGGDDDSDDGSSDASDDASVAEVAEVNIDYPDVQDLSQHGNSTSKSARLKKDESRHVTFVAPIAGQTAARRKPRVQHCQHSV